MTKKSFRFIAFHLMLWACYMPFSHQSLGGTVHADPHEDGNNNVFISASDTVTFTARSDSDKFISLKGSTYKNGRPTVSSMEYSCMSMVTFTTAAIGNINPCKINVTSRDNGHDCSTNKPFNFQVYVIKVTFADVVRNKDPNLPLSMPPRKTTKVTATVSPTLPDNVDHTINISVDNGNNTMYGSATITEPADGKIRNTREIQITGGQQTMAGPVAADGRMNALYAGGLHLQGTLDGNMSKVVGRADHGFSVAAWPCDFFVSYVGPYKEKGELGLEVTDHWVSDSGDLSDLNASTSIERITYVSGTGPFSTPAVEVVQQENDRTRDSTGYAYDPHAIQNNGDSDQVGHGVVSQIFSLADARTGHRGPAANSGFNIYRNITTDGVHYFLTTSVYPAEVMYSPKESESPHGVYDVKPGSNTASSSPLQLR